MAENEGRKGDSMDPASRLATEGARARIADAKRDGAHRGASDTTGVETRRLEVEQGRGAPEIARSQRNDVGRKLVTEGLNRGSGYEKSARPNSELQQMERRNRELNLPNSRRDIDGEANDKKHSQRRETEQVGQIDRLNRGSESERKAHLLTELQQMERRNRELNIPGDRRVMGQSGDIANGKQYRLENQAKAGAMRKEITSLSETDVHHTEAEAMAENAYNEFRNGVLNRTLEKGERKAVKVHGKDLIIPKGSSWSPESAEFWRHHGNTKETYDRFAHQYPEMQRRLAEGGRLDDIRMDPEYREAASFWFSPDKIVVNEYKNYRFVGAGFHRAALAREYSLEAVPATAYGWNEL